MDFVLSDAMRRFLCRCGFALLCCLPTWIVIRTILFPTTVEDWSAHLEKQLDCGVSIESIQTPSPQLTELKNLRIGDHSQLQKMSLDHVSILNTAEGRQVRINQIHGNLQSFWPSLSRILKQSRLDLSSDRSLSLHIQQILVLDSQDSVAAHFELRNVVIEINNRAQSLTAQFELAGPADESGLVGQGETPKITVSCQHQGPITNWFVNTDRNVVPAWLLSRVIPPLKCLNPDALINGSAKLHQSPSGWAGEFRANLQNIDLEHVVYRQFGQLLTGKNANLRINLGVIENNQLASLNGQLWCDAGRIGLHLLDACDQFGPMAQIPQMARQDHDYRSLNFGFQIEKSKLAIEAGHSGTVIYDTNHRPLLIAANLKSVPVTSLISILAFPSPSALPLTRGTAEIARYLQLPRFDPAATDRRQRTASTGRQQDQSSR